MYSEGATLFLLFLRSKDSPSISLSVFEADMSELDCCWIYLWFLDILVELYYLLIKTGNLYIYYKF